MSGFLEEALTYPCPSQSFFITSLFILDKDESELDGKEESREFFQRVDMKVIYRITMLAAHVIQ